MKWPVVLIPCGGKKRDRVSMARDLYTGTLHRIYQKWARSVTIDSRIFIVSAKHGLLTLDSYVAPYNLRLGEPGSIEADTMRAQAMRLNILNAPDIIALGGRDYLALMKQVFPQAITPATVVGMSTIDQARLIGRNYGRLPDQWLIQQHWRKS